MSLSIRASTAWCQICHNEYFGSTCIWNNQFFTVSDDSLPRLRFGTHTTMHSMAISGSWGYWAPLVKFENMFGIEQMSSDWITVCIEVVCNNQCTKLFKMTFAFIYMLEHIFKCATNTQVSIDKDNY